MPASYLRSLAVGDWLEHSVGGSGESRNRVSCWTLGMVVDLPRVSVKDAGG